MKTLGNIIWIIFGGLHIALEYFIAGLVLMITIIGIPFGLQSMKLGMLAIWPEGEVETITARLSEHIHECAVVLRRWHLDMAHPHLLRSHFLHYHHWHSLRKDALPTGKVGLVTIRKGTRIAQYE